LCTRVIALPQIWPALVGVVVRYGLVLVVDVVVSSERESVV
jgi:hypothetical protein